MKEIRTKKSENSDSGLFDLVGKRFGQLIVLNKLEERTKWGSVQWLCKCDCGNERIVTTSHLRENAKSCGQHRGTHRNSLPGKETPEYRSWLAMRERCRNPKAKRYNDYGGRGIGICERWDSFENFLEDMGRRPRLDYSLERTDNDKGYSPDNCVWADATTQNRNQRLKKSNKSGVNGIHWAKDRQKWVVRITVNYKRITIGKFENLEDAKQARIEAEKEYWGEVFTR